MEKVFAVLMVLWLFIFFLVPSFLLINYFFNNDENEKPEKEFNFTIKLDLADENTKPEHYLDLLYDAGCKEASICVIANGLVSLVFSRTEVTLGRAIDSGIRDVKKAIPNAKLIFVKINYYELENKIE